MKCDLVVQPAMRLFRWHIRSCYGTWPEFHLHRSLKILQNLGESLPFPPRLLLSDCGRLMKSGRISTAFLVHYRCRRDYRTMMACEDLISSFLMIRMQYNHSGYSM